MTITDPVDLSGFDVPGAALGRDALDALLPAVYGELRALAALTTPSYHRQARC